jgi:hypothetical protein
MDIHNKKMKFKDWLKYEMPINEIIMNASIQDGSDKLMSYMIGVSYKCELDYLVKLNNLIHNSDKELNSKLYCFSFSINTDLKRRGKWGPNEQAIRRETIHSTLKRNFNTTRGGHIFFDDLYTSMFTFSPEGNGLVEDNPEIMKKYEGLPVLYTHDYSELTGKYLQEKYQEMLEKEYDFSKLFLSSYSLIDQKIIKENGNYWVNKLNTTNLKEWWPLDLSKIKNCEKIYEELVFYNVTNFGYKILTENFILSLLNLNFKFKLLLYCLDEECYKYFIEKKFINIEVILYDCKLGNLSIFDDKNWNNITMKKINIAETLMKKYKYVLHSDGDIVFINPYFYIDTYLELKNNNVDIVAQPRHPSSNICAGYYIINSSDKTLNLYSNNMLLERKATEDRDDEVYLEKLIAEKKLTLKVLDREYYPNGNITKYRGLQKIPYMIHFNYMKGINEKSEFIKKLKLWYL